MSELDISKVLAEAKIYEIKGMDVKITPLDFEDTMRLTQCKKTPEGGIDMSDTNTLNAIKFLITKKLRQSFTKIMPSGEKKIPSDEEINSLDSGFITEYMEKVFKMNESGVKKK